MLGKRLRASHALQITLPNSKAFAEERSEKLKHGPWTLLENVILAHLIAYLKENFEAVSTDNIFSGFNEIVALSNMSCNITEIPENLMKPNHKSRLQIQSKLTTLPL